MRSLHDNKPVQGVGGLRANLWWLAVRVAATALVLLYIGPFASGADMLRMARDGAASPWQQLGAGSQASRIAVVLLDDADITELGGRWPLPVGRWADVLRRLGCAGAQSVFFDILFEPGKEFGVSDTPGRPSMAEVDQRVRTGQLTDADCPGRANPGRPVPVTYAYAGERRAWLPPVITDERKLPVQWQGPAGVYPLQVLDGQPQVASYSAAYHLYRQYCADAQVVASASPGCAHLPGAGDMQQMLIPTWPMRPPAQHARWSAQPCDDAVPAGAGQALRRWLGGWFADSVPTPCAPYLTFSGRQLVREFDADMAAALQGRIVLVGASITGARDLVDTPTHGQLPGVYLHATALENLLAHGAHFSRIEPAKVVAATLALIVLMALLHRAALHWDAGFERRAGRVAAMLAPLGIWCVVALVMRWVLNLPAGMVPAAAMTMSLGLLLGELSQEGTWYGIIRKLQPDLTARR